MGGFWSQVPAAAEEQDSQLVVFEFPEAPSRGLDRLDLAVETFGRGVGDPVAENESRERSEGSGG
jgi:hypothetical protein